MMPSKSFVFHFDDVEVREREFTLTKAGKVLSSRAEGVSGPPIPAAQSAKTDHEGRTAEYRLGRYGRYRGFPDALHLAAAQRTGR